MREFSERVIVVTGGESGIGRATVEQLAREKAIVVIGGLLEEEGAATVKSLNAAGGNVEFHKADMRSVEQVNGLIDNAVKKHGRIDGLVNNAALFDGFASCIDTSDGLWEQIMNVNVRGTFYACRAALRHMLPAGAGRIVNVASVGGLVGMADGASYTTSKHAVIGLTKHLGCFYAKNGIGVNAVCPGVIETPIRANSLRILGKDAPPMGGVGVDPDWLPRKVPAARKGKADEIANIILFLLSDKASYMNGESVVVDGGWTAA
jgi:NAD(P)-dependent dehydrogenase (short-subunit alcohol dehydrogenase family)